MTKFLLSNIIVFVCAVISFVYGTAKFFRPKKAVYAQMITLAIGCTAFGKLYQVVRLLTEGEIFDEFQLGLLGMLGSLVFLFSANYGLMDSLADDRNKKYRKYRLIPLLLPAAEITACILFTVFGDFSLLLKIKAGAVTAAAAGTSYYNLKHLIFPDVKLGLMRCMKLYNLLAILFAFISIAEVIAYGFRNETAAMTVNYMTGIVMLLMTPAVERGLKKWKT